LVAASEPALGLPNPVTAPPVIETLFAFWVAIVPNPKVVLCAEASASSNNALPAVVKS